MFLPIRTDSPLRTTPYMNWALVAANVAAFVVQSVRPEVLQQFRLNSQDPWLPTFLSYAFLHADVLHLAGNLLFLFIFGNNVNDKMGHVGYLAFYLAGAIFAGVGYAVTRPESMGMIGASGGVSAVTGAYLVLFPRSTITVFYMMFIIGTVEVPSIWFVAFYFVKDLIGLGGGGGMTAYTAHLSGTLFGFAVSLALLSVHLLPRDQFDLMALLQRWNKRRQYRDMVAKGYNPFGYTPVSRDTPASGWVAPAGAAARPGVPFAAAVGPPPPADPAAQRVWDLRASIAAAVSSHDLPKAARLYLDLKALDPQQVLARQAQLDVANQLAGQQMYPQAAEAYETFLKHYPKFEQIEQVDLMLGLIYARYLQRYDRAKECLLRATARLHAESQLEMARSELSRIEPLLAGRQPAQR